MPKRSAGLLLYRSAGAVEVLLVHPGGPYWARRDDGAWSLPKGEYTADEDPLEVAYREFREELGTDAPAGPRPAFLGEVRQSGGKQVSAWAVEGDLDVSVVRSNTFRLEWPPGSGATREFPEVDRAAWFDLDAARRKLVAGQVDFLDRLWARLHRDHQPPLSGRLGPQGPTEPDPGHAENEPEQHRSGDP